MVIVGTEVGAVEVTQFYGVPRSHIRKLPHPTPRFALESHQSADRNVVLERLGIRTPYVFYPAQFWPHKNHVNLLHAIAHLGKQSGLRISVAFSGSDRGNLRYVEQVARELGIAEQVHFLGFVTRAELTSLYEGAIALAYVSFGGPENLPPLEAFALGCPVIAADIEGAREQLADAALLVNPSDPQKIAETIRQIHEDAQLRSDLIARGRQRAAAWTGTDFVRAALRVIDEFAAIRRCWPT
jgi:glycosyltransferase involved in cell wall biosynthesis